MTKFTKGKWVVLPLEEDKEYIRIRGSVLGGRYKIADVIDLKFHHQPDKQRCSQEREESLANANLISVAPEMYEMISTLLPILDEHSARKASELLARARGE